MSMILFNKAAEVCGTGLGVGNDYVDSSGVPVKYPFFHNTQLGEKSQWAF
jgi:hypothetical protein